MTTIVEVSEREWAWAAGFFDGEGWVGCSMRTHHERRYPYTRLAISIAQVDREVLDKFAAIVGFGKVSGPYKPKTKNSNPYFHWTGWNREDIRTLAKSLSPYLSTTKMTQFENAIKLSDDYKAGQAMRYSNAARATAAVRKDQVIARCD